MSDLLDRLFPAVPPPPHREKQTLRGIAAHDDLRWKEGGTPSSTDDELSTRWRVVLSLQLRGWSQGEIAEHLHLHPNTIAIITKDERYIAFRQEYLADMDGDFISLKPLAITALKNGLSSSDENTALRASEQWFKGASFGGYSKTPEPDSRVTAEDVARQLLNITADNVQVNITHNHVAEGDDE